MLKPYEGPARVVVGFDGSEDALSRAPARDRRGDGARGRTRPRPRGRRHRAQQCLGRRVRPRGDQAGCRLDAGSRRRRAVEAGMARNRVRTEIVLGNPAAALTRLSAQASLIVVGRRSNAAGERQYVGSTSVGVVGTAHCPVIVVSDNDIVREQRTGLIGVAVDTSARGAVALEWALSECQDHGGKVVVISVCRAPQGRWFSGGQPTQEQRDAAVEVTRARMTEMISEITEDFPASTSASRCPTAARSTCSPRARRTSTCWYSRCTPPSRPIRSAARSVGCSAMGGARSA